MIFDPSNVGKRVVARNAHAADVTQGSEGTITGTHEDGYVVQFDKLKAVHWMKPEWLENVRQLKVDMLLFWIVASGLAKVALALSFLL